MGPAKVINWSGGSHEIRQYQPDLSETSAFLPQEIWRICANLSSIQHKNLTSYKIVLEYSPQNDFNQVYSGSPKLTPVSNWQKKVSMLDEWEVSSYMREISLAFAHGLDMPCPHIGKCESINIPWGASNVCEGLSGQLLQSLEGISKW